MKNILKENMRRFGTKNLNEDQYEGGPTKPNLDSITPEDLYKTILNQTGYEDYFERDAADVKIGANRGSFGPIKKFVTKLLYGKSRAKREAGSPEAVARLILQMLQNDANPTKLYTGVNDEFIENWYGFKLPDYLDNVYQGKPLARRKFQELGNWVNKNTKDTWGIKYPYNDKWYQRLARNVRKDDGMDDTTSYDSGTLGG